VHLLDVSLLGTRLARVTLVASTIAGGHQRRRMARLLPQGAAVDVGYRNQLYPGESARQGSRGRDDRVSWSANPPDCQSCGRLAAGGYAFTDGNVSVLRCCRADGDAHRGTGLTPRRERNTTPGRAARSRPSAGRCLAPLWVPPQAEPYTISFVALAGLRVRDQRGSGSPASSVAPLR
jgi:hypothetical protein